MAFFSIDFDVSTFRAALAAAPGLIEAKCMAVAEQSARNIARDAQARVHRRSGLTAEGIEVLPDPNGKGWMVESTRWGSDGERKPFPNLPLVLEFGSEHQRPEKYFGVSVKLEEPTFARNLADAITEGIVEAGLGE